MKNYHSGSLSWSNFPTNSGDILYIKSMAIFRNFLVMFVIMMSSCSNILPTPAAKDPLCKYDFAPLKVSTKWEYSYYFRGSYDTPIKDSANIRIHLFSQRGTLIFLNIRKVGFSIGFHFDTTRIDSQYTDTVIVSDSSISPAPGYRCEIFPFWKSHGICSDSLRKIFLGKDSIAIFEAGKILGYGSGDSIYFQDVGLYSKFRITCCNTASTWSIKLLSFNDIPILKDTVFYQ
jgi:hypothetical protein